MPAPPEELFMTLCQLAVQVHARYVPAHGRGALYLRPTLYAEEEALGVRPATRHRLAVAVTPCSDPQPKSMRRWAEYELIRAAPGGPGAAKIGRAQDRNTVNNEQLVCRLSLELKIT